MAAPGGSDEKISVFISYSRDDLAFADQLDAALRLHKFGVVLDRKGISGGEEWQPRLGAMIRDADTVAFVLSPASAASPVCKWEVAEAVRLGKRIIPVVCRPIGGAAPPEQLAERNYIYFYDEPDYPGSGFGTGLVRLVETLETDLAWLREGTRLLQRATEWDEGQRSDSRLLFGDSIAAAKGWLARQPKNAPVPTTVLLDYMRASEEQDARRQSEESQRLAEREELVRKAEAEQAEREAAQRREAEQARRAVRIRTIGLAVALVLAAVAGVAGLNAWRGREALAARTLDLEAANERLGAEMRLRVAPFGKQAYEIPEQWYKLATSNASSVAFAEFRDDKGWWRPAASGFVIRGKELYPPWGEQPVFVTAGHIYHEQRKEWGKNRGRIQFPALKNKPHVRLGALLWVTAEPRNTDDVDFETADTTVFSLAETLFSGVQPITGVSDLDVMQWLPAKFLSGEDSVQGSALDKVVPLITLGAVSDADPDNMTTKEWPFRLTLSLANALGRDQRVEAAKGKFVATDSTTLGSSGSPIFDASDGRLVGIIQYGTGDPKRIKAGLAYSGGTTMRTIKLEIANDAATAAHSSRKMFLEGKIELAEMYLNLAQTHDATAPASLAGARAEGYVKRGTNLASSGAEADAIAHFATALQIDPTLAGRVNAAWSEAYVERGKTAMRGGKIAGADALFQQAHRKSPDNAKTINAAWAMAYVQRGEDAQRSGETAAEVDAVFLQAHQKSPDNAKSINAAWAMVHVQRGEDALRSGKTAAEADALFQDAHRKSPADAESINRAWSEAHFERGKAFLDKGGAEDAEVHFRRAIEVDSNAAQRVADEYLWRGRKQLEAGRDDAARVYFDAAVQRDPAAAREVNSARIQAFLNRGREFLTEGKLSEAETMLDRALKQDVAEAANTRTLWAHILADRVEALLASGEDEAAEKIARQAVAHDAGVVGAIEDRWAYAYVRRGAEMLKNGDTAEAKAQFALARSRSGADRRHAVKGEIARTWLRHGKPEEGLADAEAYFASGESTGAAAQIRGRVYLALGRIAHALADLDQAVTLGHRSAVTYFDRGRCHELTGNQTAAIKDYQEALRYVTNDEDGRNAQEQARARLKAMGVELRAEETSR